MIRVLFCFLMVYMGVFSVVQAKVVILACEPEWAALAHEIGADKVTIISATHAKQDPHHVEARPSLIAAARKADLVVGTGAELESGWLPMVIQKANNSKIVKGQPGYVMFAESFSLKKNPEHMKTIDRAMGDIHAAGNPHIQLEPRLYLEASKVLMQRLSQIDALHGPLYQQNYLIFKKKWEDNLQRWAQASQPLKGMKIIVYHDNWIYLNDWLGLVQVTTLEPKPGVPPSAGYLKSVLLKTKKEQIKAILHTPYEPVDAAKWLHQKTGIPVVELPFTVGASKETQDLTGLFDHTIQLLLRLKK